MSRNLLLFFIMCLVWGLTWWPVKVGMNYVPPFFLGGVRFTLAGMLMLLAARADVLRVPRHTWARLLGSAILLNLITYALLFWGIERSPTGLAAVVNFGAIPLFSLLFGALWGEEKLTRGKIAAVGIGFAGLALLFSGRIETGLGEGLGLVAIVFATASYCLGAVMSRPIAHHIPTMALAGWQTLIGGAGLIGLTLVFEPVGWKHVSLLAQWPLWPAMAFLVLGGSLLGFPIYTRLLREWGAFGAGLYAFVSPVIAIAAGVLALGETISVVEILGALLMFGGAGLALGRGRG